MTRPWLSVITPTYNGAAYLADTLDSVLLQQDPDIECIVVDGGSTDATLSILRTYELRLALRVIESPRSGGWVASTNHALSLAGGEYVTLLHQDDIWLKDRLRTMRRMIQQFPGVDFFLHPSTFIDAAGRTLGKWSCPLPRAPMVISADHLIERLLVQN